MSEHWDYWEARDAWESTYYIVKDPPIAWGFMFEGQLAYDGDDFCMGFSFEESMILGETTRKEVRRWIAEAYANGDICPEEIDWNGDAEIEWPRPPRTCTPAKPCWGSAYCRALATQPRDEQDIHLLVRSLSRRPLSPRLAKRLEEHAKEREKWKLLSERSRAETQARSAEKPAEAPSKPAMPSTPQVLVEKPAIPWIALEEVPEPANHGLAAFWAFAKSLWKKAPAGPNRGRPPSST